MKIIAVVVTYNRLELLKRSMDCLRQNKPLSAIIVVNNGSTDGTREWLDKQDDLTVIHQSNVGGSGGFYTGIEAAYAKNADWIWCMDDDVFPRADCLETYCPTPAIKRWGSWLPDDYWKVKSLPTISVRIT